MAPQSQSIRPKTAAELLGIGTSTFWRWAKERSDFPKLPSGFTARDVWKKGWAGIKTTADAETALAILEEHSWLVSLEGLPESGRPTTRYLINPKARAA